MFGISEVLINWERERETERENSLSLLISLKRYVLNWRGLRLNFKSFFLYCWLWLEISMDKSEPALAPEWYRTGNITSGNNSNHQHHSSLLNSGIVFVVCSIMVMVYQSLFQQRTLYIHFTSLRWLRNWELATQQIVNKHKWSWCF